MVFKERLKEKRTEANLTQVELAEKAGVTARTIQNYEPVSYTHLDVYKRQVKLSIFFNTLRIVNISKASRHPIIMLS